jgi:NAD(P)-dependent dehydrogenase (short-subunit alcohol dehydrogenase family)
MRTTNLTGKVVIVTGAGSGLGEATAKAFAQAGCTVVCLDVRPDAAERVRQECNGDACAWPCDVSNEAMVFQVVDEVVHRFDRLDVVVNNAAIDHTLSIAEMSPEQWDQVIAVNLRGPFLLAKAALPIMQRQKYGHFVNIASTAATRAWANAAAYHASKWGLIGFSRGLSVEGRPHNIRVTTVLPGGMRTHFFDRFAESGIPMPDEQNLQDPANVAAAIVFAVQMPAQSVIQEMMVTPLTETSWP